MSHKHVSNKAVLRNEGFLAKLGSTLLNRTNPDPLVDTKTQSSISWRKTSDVKARIKTATGTIPVYDDVSQSEMERMEKEATEAAGGSAPNVSGPVAVAFQEAAIAAGLGDVPEEEREERQTTVTVYLANEDYNPEDSDGLTVVAGQKLNLVDKSSPHKRQKVDEDGSHSELLDNSAAKHKMAIRPKRNHPDPRSRMQETAEERWLVCDPDSGKQGLVPSRLLELHSQTTSSILKASMKRSVQHIAMEETLEVKKNLMKEIREFKTRRLTSRVLGPSPEDEARTKRAATIRELIETEEEFVRDLHFVMEKYYSLMEDPATLRSVKDQKELIFNNFKYIADFHKNVLIEGVKYNAEVPTMIGRTFLRLERDFDKHAEYCSNEPLAQEFLQNNIPVKEYFEEYSQNIGDEKRLEEHLKLPIQRLNDYQLLLRELVKYSSRLGEETTDLQRAYDLMQTIPQRATDAKFISSIEGFKGNLFKLGRLIRHDWFSVKESGQRARDRYVFLFKARILITKVKRIGEDRSIFILKDIIRLPETSLGGLDNPKGFQFFHIESVSHPNYPILIEAKSPEIRDSWLGGIKEFVVDTASVEDLLFDDELRVVSQDADEEEAGAVSPIPEVQDFEDLPEDGADEAVERFFLELEREEQQEPPPPPLTPPAKRVEPQGLKAEQVVGQGPEGEQAGTAARTPSSSTSSLRTGDVQGQQETKEREEREEKERLRKEEREAEEKREREERERLEREREKKEERERKDRERLEVERKEKEGREREEKERLEREKEEKERLEREKEEKERFERERKEKEERERQEKERLERERKEKEEKERLEKEETERLERERKEKEEKARIERERKENEERKEKEEKERLERERKEKEEKERLEREKKEKEEKERLERERKEKEEREIKEKEEKERLERERKEKEEKERLERERKEKEEKERKEKERLERERREKEEKERLEKERKEKEEKEKLEKERKEKEERERKEKERLEKEKKEKEEKERLERERKEKEEKERVERERKEKEEKEIQERKEKEEKERKEKERLERERKEKEEKERLEREKKEKEEKERKEKERLERERKEKEEKERLEKERKEKEEKEKLERERKEKEEKERIEKERLEREKKEKEEKEKLERERKEKEEIERQKREKEERDRLEEKKKEKEESERKEKERKEKAEQERKEKEEREKKELEAKLRKEKEEKERKEKEEKEENERKEKIERERKEKEEKERKEKEEKERKDKEIKERKEKEEKEKIEREKKEKEEKEKIEKERKEKEEEEKKEKIEKERKEKEEKERKEKEEKEKIERERKEKEEKVKKEKIEKERKEKEEKERKEREEKDKKDKIEKERKEKEEKEKIEKERKEKEDKERIEKERQEKIERERKEKAERERKDSKPSKEKGVSPKASPAPPPSSSHLIAMEKETPPPMEASVEDAFELMAREAVQDEEETEVEEFWKASASTQETTVSVVETKPEAPKVPKLSIPEPEAQLKPLKPPEAEQTKGLKPAATMAEPTTPFTPGGTPKPIFTKTIKGDVVEPGESVSFGCEVTHPAPYFVTWLKDSKPLDDKLADRIQQQDAGRMHSLKVMNCRVQDSGIYSAKATDEAGSAATCSAQLLVQELTEEERARRIAEKSPFFLVRMKHTEVIENTNLSYTIHVKGDPMPDVQFFKDDQEIKEDSRVTLHRDHASGHYELLITHVQRGDEGTYKCLARNKFGRAECEATMIVSDEQMVYESLSGKGSLLSQGEKADFKWFRDGQEFDPVERFNVLFKDDEDTLALVFQNVTPEDAGLYTCVASTSCGRISCSAELTVEGSVNRLLREPEAPMVKEEMIDVQVASGGSAMLECKIGGYPKPEIECTKNGLDLQIGGRLKFLWEDEESLTLIIKNVEEKDAGLYTLVARNELGEVSTSANVTIKAGPKIKKFLKEVPCILGNNLDYRVEVEGEPAPDMRWMKDGKPLEESDRIKIVRESNKSWTLKIQDMQAGDCGAYTMVASNPMGQVSEFFNVESDSAPQIVRGLDQETERKMSHDLIFEVRCTGSPRPGAKWTHNGKEIMGDDKFKMVRDDNVYMLKIRKLERKDKGTYKCELVNSNGSASTEGELIVRAPPDLVTPLKDACAKEGTKDIKLFVQWDSNPKPSVKWFVDGKPIREETPGYTIRGQDTSQILTIHEAIPDFVGTYSVKLTNEYGETESKAKFRLHEIPAVTEGLQDVEFLEGNTCKYTFKATGVPLPEIKWTKDGKKWSPDDSHVKLKVEGEDTFSLVFDGVKTEDAGHYVANISNVEGSTSTEGNIVVITPPHVKGSNFRDGKTFIAMHKFLLEVEASAVPEAEATWYCNGNKLSEEEDNVKFGFDGKKFTLERFECDPEHSGEYKCVLKNKVKEVEEVGQVTVKEKEARVRKGLEDVFIKEFTDATLKCQIVGDPIPEIQWLRNGKPLALSDKFEVSSERMSGWQTLVVKDLKEEDQCSFTVKGKNQHGECETSCQLGVQVKPQPGPLDDAVVDYGRDLLLPVKIHANPPPKMVWSLMGKELHESEHYEYVRDEKKEEYGLLIHFAVLEDAGNITFTASNMAGSSSASCNVKVFTEEPSVVGALEDLNYCLEDDVTFTLRATGLPLPECQWKKKGVPLQEDERHVFSNPEPGVYCLTIKDLNMADYGDVSVVAKSLVGECSSSATLTQKKLPCEVVEGLDNLTKGVDGEDVTLTAKIRASPRPTFVWTKDGDECEASAKIKIDMKKTSYCEATISLTLMEAASADSGQYRLRFKNEINETSTETALIVRAERAKPKITKKPQPLEVMENTGCIFEAKITGFPRPEVKWLKDGHQVYLTDVVDAGMTADGFYYLEFKVITEEDAGHYTVCAVNEEGSAEAETSLTVLSPPAKPEFLQSLRASKVILGYPVRMEVKLGGSPMPEIQWLKDGQPLQVDGKHIKQVVDPDGTVFLQIDSAKESDMGEITCVAKNSEGDSKSSATLSVLGFTREDGQPDGPAKFTEGLKDMCFDEGQTMKLPVAMKGGPVPNMKWYKDGEEIKVDDRVFFTYDGDRSFLEIRPTHGTDSGIYKCVIENSHGSAETECEVTIRKAYEPPLFTSAFPNQAKLPGRDVKMAVRYDGVPAPELSWYFNGEPISMDADKFRIRKEGDGQTLTLKDCTYSDSGFYKVVAKNREGQVEHEAELDVSDDVDPNRKAEAPVFLKVIGDQEVFEGYKALFKAIVVGRPEPEFKWFMDGHPIVATNRVIIERDSEGLIRLTINQVGTGDAGMYELKAWNDYGEAACQGKLICETLTSRKKRPVGDEYQGFDRLRRSGVPLPLPDKPMISALSDRRATITWMPYLSTFHTKPVTYQLEMCECPEGDWVTVRTGIIGCGVDITSLLPKSDYKFRVRVANKHGVSEPSPYVMTMRHKLELPPINYEPKMDPNYDYKGDGPFVPEGFRISRDKRGNYFAAPRFLRLDHDTQYGLRGFNAYIKWYAYGYPHPKIRFLHNDRPIDFGRGSRYTYTYDPMGEICLFIDKMTEVDIGPYECFVTNEHGESRQRIKMALSEYPRVLQPLEELHLRANTSGKIMCRISGYPACDVKWYKDWEPIIPSFRLRPSFSEPDWFILNFHGISTKEAGLYSVSAVNVAGSVHSSCMVHVEEDDTGFYWTAPGMGRQIEINHRRGTLEDHYDIGDELGRGTQGVIYHCVEHHTGRNLAAKSMWGKDNFKMWMHNEFDMMNFLNTSRNIVRLYDAYEGPKNMVLVTELCGGGELLYALTQRRYLTEYEVCVYIRQVLLGLEYMHDLCIAHLGLNIGDILMVRPNGMEVKIGDMSLARRIRINEVHPLDYGMPEFVAPEVANGEGVTYAADMWAVGVITYILLSGTSPFRGENDRETLSRVKQGEMSFDMEAFSHISNEAKDFIAKLLVFQADVRMDVKAALKHPWMQLAFNMPREAYRINTDRLRSYYSKYRDWYANASCKRWFRRRTLSSCLTHPSKMVYPPGEVYTPPESPEREILPAKKVDYEIPHREYSYEVDDFKNESNYQLGPDTYLLQLRDVEFPCRLRSYMKVATARSPSFALSLRDNDYDYSRIPVVHERRRFTDIMDEQIDDERRRRIVDRYTAGFIRSRMETCSLDIPRRVKQEISSRLAIREEVNAIREETTFGTSPFLREKPSTCAITNDCPLTLNVVVTGEPEPVVQWFKNDVVMLESNRINIESAPGRSVLSFTSCNSSDAGLYKVVARNQLGQSTHKFRLVQGQIPGPCDCPGVTEVSSTEALVRWRAPMDDGGSHILCYHLQMKLAGETEWKTIADNIDHEFYLVRDLAEESVYHFRIAAKNFMGWGEFSASTTPVKTASAGAAELHLTKGMQFLQKMTEGGKIIHPWPEKRELDYSKEREPMKLKSGENAELQVRKYNFMAEISRGRFSLVTRCVRSDDQRQFAAKLSETKESEHYVREEFEVLCFMKHERIAQLYEAYFVNNVTVFVMEPLSGVDILTYLASQYQYSEQTIFSVVMQVLDALSYIHWRGYCHLDLQPDNIVLTTTRRCDVKLVDFGSAQMVSRMGTPVPLCGLLEYMAPEVLSEQRAFPNSDIWSLGALTYMMMSGSSAFKGLDEDETRENIQFVRYRFDRLGSNTSQEAIRFLMLIFKRDPSKRPTVEECRDHRWLVENDYMTKRRERAVFFGSQLAEYDMAYHKARAASATKCPDLLNFNNASLPQEVSYDPEMRCTV